MWNTNQTLGQRGLHDNNPSSAEKGQYARIALGVATLPGQESEEECLSWCVDEQKETPLSDCG